jgi:hypothetical protein
MFRALTSPAIASVIGLIFGARRARNSRMTIKAAATTADILRHAMATPDDLRLPTREELAEQGRKEIERLRNEVRTFRAGFEGALRYVPEEVYDDVRSPFDPKSKGFTPEYRNDLASMRAARALLS